MSSSPPSTIQQPQRPTNHHFTRSPPKLSLATFNTNALVLVPSNGQPVSVAPITNISTMPLYLLQPFLSPNPTTTTSSSSSSSTSSSNTTSNTNTTPNTTSNTIISQPSTPYHPISLHLFPNPPSFPTSPFTSNIPPHHLRPNSHPPSPSTLKLLQKIFILFLHLPKNYLPIIKPTIPLRTHTNRTLAWLMQSFNLRKNDKLLSQAEKTIILSDHYCCFAIPLYNTGIYSILAQFTIFGFVFGILSFSAPSIIAIVLDFSFTAIFGVLCLLTGSIQALGFFGVYKEKPLIFKKYLIGNLTLLALTFLYSFVLLVISSTKHHIAIDQCLLQFVSNDEFIQGPSSTSEQVCSIWTYAQLGVCFFVWLLFFISQSYFAYMVKIWGQDQKLDHIRYQSIISAVRQSHAASTLHPGLLDGGEGDEWESRSRAGSFDIHSSTYCGHSTHRNGKLAPNGGSRLKNEIEWKEIDPDFLNHHHHPQPSHPPLPTAQQSSISSSASRKQKSKAQNHQEPDHYQQSSSSILPPSTLHQRSTKSPRLDPASTGNWIEAIDQPLSSSKSLPADHQLDVHRPQYPQKPADDREYYQPKLTP